jgi:hypothetical protein
MTNADIDDFINQFYQNELPRLLNHSEFAGWFEFSTADGDDGQYDIESLASDDGENIIGIDSSYITVDGSPITAYLDRASFFTLWPEDVTHDSDKPMDMLIEGRSLWLRPPPDDAYTVKLYVTRKIPAELANDTDKPIDQSWGPVIAYGASVLVMEDKGRDATKAEGRRNYYVALANRDGILRDGGKSTRRGF